MKKLLLASVCTLALGATCNAYAQGFVASLDGDWNRTDIHFCCGGLTSDGYDANAAVDLPWSYWGIGLELNAGAHSLRDDQDYQGGGSLVWNGQHFRLAGTVVYNDATLLRDGTSVWQAGGGFEWYANRWLTISAQGGGIEGPFKGGYVGGTVKGYPGPNLSLAGYILHTGASGGANSIGTKVHGNETDYGLKAEWLLPWDMFLPLSVTARYEHTDINGGFACCGPFHARADTIFVGAKLYFDEEGAPQPLVERNRTGTLDTIGPIAPLAFRGGVPD